MLSGQSPSCHPLGLSSSHFHGLRVFVTWTERCCEADLWLPIGFRKGLGDHAFTEIRRFQIAWKHLPRLLVESLGIRCVDLPQAPHLRPDIPASSLLSHVRANEP